MKIKFRNHVSPEFRATINALFELGTAELFSDELSKDIEVDVRLTTLHWYFGHSYSTWVDSKHSPRKFVLYLDSSLEPKRGLVNTVLHELVKIYQFASGDLVDSLTEPCLWLGKEVNHLETNFDDLPWMQEAKTIGEEIQAEWYEIQYFLSLVQHKSL